MNSEQQRIDTDEHGLRVNSRSQKATADYADVADKSRSTKQQGPHSIRSARSGSRRSVQTTRSRIDFDYGGAAADTSTRDYTEVQELFFLPYRQKKAIRVGHPELS